MEDQTLEQQLEASKKTVADLQAENAGLKAEVKDANEMANLLEAENAALKNKPSDKPANETFEVDGKKYEILVGKLNIPGVGIRTALEIAVADEEIRHALVASGSDAIKEVK